jgi:uncharacterized membrane protein (DUF373 family)
VKLLDHAERYIAYTLLALMLVVVASATLEVGYEVVTNLFRSPGFFMGVEDLFEVFSLFLMVLIGVELIASIRMFLKDHRIHAELMLLVAITAVTRKVVILDAKAVEPMTLFGIGFILIALTVGYYLLRHVGNIAKPETKSPLPSAQD